jgi:hypothetical protein
VPINRARLSKANAAYLAEPDLPSHYFKPLFDQWLIEHEKEQTRKWKGWISPSKQIKYSMCMEEFFHRIDAPFKVDEPAILCEINSGTEWHTIMSILALRAKLRYPEEPDYSMIDMSDKGTKKFFARAIEKKEVAIMCPKTGIRGYIDEVLDIDGHPAVFDLKNKRLPVGTWKSFVKGGAKPEHIVQGMIYANRLNALGIYSKRVLKVGLGYLNHAMPPLSKGSYAEHWFDYNDYKDMTNNLIKMLMEVREAKLAGQKTFRCRNPLCIKGCD